MLRILRVIIPAAVVSLSIHACIFSPETEDPPAPPTQYVPQTTPESVVFNLQVSYRRKEIDQYAKLLAKDFQFVFQVGDPSRPPEGFWTRHDDSTGTEALFRTPEVIDIRIDLIHGPPEDPSEVGFDDDVKLIRINQTLLEVDEQVGITWQVTDLQDMFLRPGRAENEGEDPNLWYLLEWRDIPTASQSPGVRPLSAVPEPGPRASSWGSLRGKFGTGGS
jgi:hypothetical protein